MPNKNQARGLNARGYERLVQSVIDYAIYMIDLEGRVSSCNPGAERIKGYSADEIVGEHFSRFYTPEERDLGIPQQALRRAAEQAAESWAQTSCR